MILFIKLFIFATTFYQLESLPSRYFSGKFDQVTSLPGLNIDLPYRHYSGYLNSLNGTFLYYWFFESQSQHPKKDPLVLWLNGGPGCSSLFGALLESGPLRLEADGTMTANPFSLNSNANILFLESPAGVGFSYKSNVSTSYDYATDDHETALINFEAMRSFYRKFPQYIRNDFYLTGESYAGIYISTLSMLLLDRTFPVNFKGVSIGNAMLDQRYALNSRIQFAHQHRLINDSIWSTLHKYCCPNKSNSIRDCAFQNITMTTINTLQPPECKMWYLATQMHILDYPRNVYNYKQNCLERSAGSICTNKLDNALLRWFNRRDVQHAMHIVNRHNKAKEYLWNDCNPKIFKSYRQNVISVHKKIQTLLKKNIKVLLYYGDLDLACTYISGQWFIDDLKLTPMTAEIRPWFYEDQLAAHLQIYKEGLAYVQIKNAGHEALRNKPAFSKQMFDEFLNLLLFNVEE